MKMPRFFIALFAFAVAFTIASSSAAPLLRSCAAESMPVLRVDPRMGDPEDPKGPMEIPFDEWGANTSVNELAFNESVLGPRSPRATIWVDLHYIFAHRFAPLFVGWRY